MRRVLGPDAFARWLADFLPDIPTRLGKPWLEPAIVIDRADPKLAHTDGLNLSRAWMLEGIADGLPARRSPRAGAASRRAAASRRGAARGNRRALRGRPLARGVRGVSHERGRASSSARRPASAMASSAATRSSSAVPTLLNRVIAAGWERLKRPDASSVSSARTACGLDDSARHGARRSRRIRRAHRGVCRRKSSARASASSSASHISRGEGAHQIEVLAGTQPRAAHQRLSRKRGAAHDVGPADRGLEIIGGLDAQMRAAQGCGHGAGAFRAPSPDANLPNRAAPARGFR